MTRSLPLALLLSLSFVVHAQEGGVPTQLLVAVDGKDAPVLTAGDIAIEVNNRRQPPTRLAPVAPEGSQIALLIDEGLRTSVGRELPALRAFVTGLPAGIEVLVGYMSNGRVQQESFFTTDHAAAAARLRLPLGLAGISASPYFCLSEFVRHWPVEGFDGGTSRARARFVLMITNGVDPYNGSTSPLNQDSPYVRSATLDAQRAGVPVYSIYYADSGVRGGSASFSGQSYLAQIAEGTGGRAYYQGTGNPVSLAPLLKEFQHDVAASYVASFQAAAAKELVDVRVRSNVPHVKVRAAQAVRVGNVEAAAGGQ